MWKLENPSFYLLSKWHKAVHLLGVMVHACSVSIRLNGLWNTDATGLWKSKPISVSESWGTALCIQTPFYQADTMWQWRGLVRAEGQSLDTLWQFLTGTRGTEWLGACTHMRSATTLGQRGGNSAKEAVFWVRGWPGILHQQQQCDTHSERWGGLDKVVTDRMG